MLEVGSGGVVGQVSKDRRPISDNVSIGAPGGA
jgi:hypothetical protein